MNDYASGFKKMENALKKDEYITFEDRKKEFKDMKQELVNFESFFLKQQETNDINVNIVELIHSILYLILNGHSFQDRAFRWFYEGECVELNSDEYNEERRSDKERLRGLIEALEKINIDDN